MHGEAERDAVVAASQALFGRGELDGAGRRRRWPPSLAELPSAEVDVTASGWPLLVDLFAATGLAPSKSAARRAVAEGGAYLNNVRVTDPEATASAGDLLAGRVAGAAPRQAQPGRGAGPGHLIMEDVVCRRGPRNRARTGWRAPLTCGFVFRQGAV